MTQYRMHHIAEILGIHYPNNTPIIRMVNCMGMYTWVRIDRFFNFITWIFIRTLGIVLFYCGCDISFGGIHNCKDCISSSGAITILSMTYQFGLISPLFSPAIFISRRHCKETSSALLTFRVKGIQRCPVDSPHKRRNAGLCCLLCCYLNKLLNKQSNCR